MIACLGPAALGWKHAWALRAVIIMLNGTAAQRSSVGHRSLEFLTVIVLSILAGTYVTISNIQSTNDPHLRCIV